MKKRRRLLLKCLSLITFVCVGINCAAKTDAFTGVYNSGAGTDTFTDIDVFGINTNPANNPFGAPCVLPVGSGTKFCDGDVFGPNVTSAPFPYEVATVTFFSNGNFTIVPNATQSSVNDPDAEFITAFQNAGLNNSAPCDVPGQPSAAFTVGTSLTATPGSTECTNAGSWTLNPPNPAGQAGGGIFTYVSNGEFIAADTSLEVAFQLPTVPTPEPPSLALFGTGILAIGLLFRRSFMGLPRQK